VELRHTFTVPIGIEQAWAAFTDIERIAPCLPGATITSVDGDTFEGTAKVKLGPIALQYGGSGRWVSRDGEAYSAVIDAQGKDKRGNGTAGATIRAHLEPAGSGTTVVVDTDLKITGRPAQFGRGVIQDVGTRLLDQFAACLAVRLAEPAPEPVTSEEPAAIATGSSDASQLEGAQPAEIPPGPPAEPAPFVPSYTPPPPQPADVNLGSVIGPVLLKRYGKYLGALAVVAVIVWLVSRD